MRWSIVFIVIMIIGLIWNFGFRKDEDFFDYDPIKQSELNFDDPYSEDLYVNCVDIENMVLKANQIKGCPVNSKTYPGLLSKSKQYCRCVSSNKVVLKTIHKAAIGVQIKKDTYKKAMQKAHDKCVGIKSWSR